MASTCQHCVNNQVICCFVLSCILGIFWYRYIGIYIWQVNKNILSFNFWKPLPIPSMVHFFMVNVGKYTVRPMDAMWFGENSCCCQVPLGFRPKKHLPRLMAAIENGDLEKALSSYSEAPAAAEVTEVPASWCELAGRVVSKWIVLPVFGGGWLGELCCFFLLMWLESHKNLLQRKVFLDGFEQDWKVDWHGEGLSKISRHCRCFEIWSIYIDLA